MAIDEKAVFIAALALPDAGEREAYLQEACAGQPELLGRLRELLSAHEESWGPLDRRPASPGDTVDAAHLESPGTVIGPYKLIEQIGEGGMGTVWMAQQTEPVKRLVAVKLIKAGMDSRQVIARFEAERQALALMDHANIARVLDAGATSAGRPYFVMDLVKGVPITKYCDDHHLTPRQRLELFIPICQAVQHAHQKGIIHRDLKPSNVLVALYDGKPVPKVIDFGVAKATGQPLTDKTLVTGFGSIVGTLEYMSPEQAEVNQLDIDTRSDIYSLGVLLYELLAGSPPFTRKDLEKAGMLEMLRLIREQEPSKPSTKLSTAKGLPTLAANRGTEPAKLTRLLRGELDWIVMKALEKDRGRRYETANGLALDVQRYLADETVQACPPSVSYRLGKVLRRHKGSLLAVSLVALALVVGIVGTTWGMILANDAATEMDKARGEAVLDRDRKATAEKQAKQDRDDAVAQRNHAFHLQYAVGMSPLARLWRDGAHGQVRYLLDALRPAPGEEDPRGWEWHHQDRLSRGALRTLEGHHDGHVLDMTQGLAFSPSGRWLASCGGPDHDRGELVLWDAATGQEVRRFHDQDQKLHLLVRVAFSPDGKTLAASDWVNTVHLWDVASGRLLHTLESNLGTVEIQSLVFSPDGRLLASAAGGENGSQDTVKVWEVASGQSVGKWRHGAVFALAFHSEGQLLTVTHTDVTLHDPATGKAAGGFAIGTAAPPPARPRKRDEDEPDAAAVSPDGTRVAVAVEDGIQLWNLTTGKKGDLLKERTKKDTNALLFSPDGLRLAAAGKDGAVEMWDFRETASRNSTIRILEEGITRMAFSTDGLRLAVTGRDGAIQLWDAGADGQEARHFRGLGGRLGIRRVAFTPDGGQFLVLPTNPIGRHEMVYLCDTATGQKLPGQEGGNGPVAYSPDGRWLASACQEGIRLWDPATCRAVRTIHTTHACARLSFVGDGRLVSVLWGTDQQRNSPYATVKLWDAATGRELATFAETDVISPDGRHAATHTTGSPDNPAQLMVWDLDKWRPGEKNAPATFQPHTKMFSGFAFSPDGKLLASTGRDKDQSWSVKLWDAATLKEVRSIPWPKDLFFGGVIFSPDGRFLAASGDGLIKAWEVTGREVFTSEGKEQGRTLTFSPDGRYLAALGDGRVKVWDVKPGRELFSAEAKAQEMTLSFSPDGRYLAVLGRDYRKVDSLKVWEATGRPVLSYQWKGTGELKPRINLAFSPDSSALAASDVEGANKVWDLATGRERFILKVASPNQVGFIEAGIFGMFGAGLAFSPDGRSLATGNPVMHLWDATSGAELHSPGHIGPVAGMAVSPVGRTLATGQGQVVRLWELETWKPLGTFGGHSGEVSDIAFSPDGRLLSAGDGIWDLTQRQAGGVQPPTRRLEGQPKAVGARAFSPNGQQLFTFAVGTVKTWDVASGGELSSGKFAPEKLGGVAFSPDGKLLACGDSNAVRLWDLAAGKEVRVLTVEDRLRRGTTISALAFSPDGRRLAALGVGVIRIWDMRTLQELYTIAPVEAATALAFSSDGGWLAVGEGLQIVSQVVTPWTGSTTGAGAGREHRVVFYDGRPLTPEREVEREATMVLDQLFDRPLPRQAVLDQVRADPALPEPVRQAALRLIEHHREEEDPKRYAHTARLLARSAHLPAAWHGQALSQAEAACSLAPSDGDCLTALGMAQYRLGRYADALRTLTLAEPLNARRYGNSTPTDLALLALVHHRLGHKDEARELRDRLHKRLPTGPGPHGEEVEMLYHEVEVRIDGTPPSPTGEVPKKAPAP